MPDLFVVNQGIVQRRAVTPPQGVDGAFGSPRLTGQLDLKTQNLLTPLQSLAVEDSYYTYASQGTRDTGLAIGATAGATYSTTNAALVIVNTNPAGGMDVILDYIRIKCDTIAGGTPTFWQIYHAIDAGNRYSSGTGRITGFNAAGSDAPGVALYSGTIVTTAVTDRVRDVGQNLLNNGASVAQAQWLIKFGHPGPQASTFTTPTTAVAQSVYDAPPIVIHPGFSYVMNEYWTGRTTTALIAETLVGLSVR